MPWAPLVGGDADIVASAASEEAVRLLFGTMPSLADLPARCEAAIRTLTRHSAEPATQTKASDDTLARAAALVAALDCSARAAGSLGQRLERLGGIPGTHSHASEVRFPLHPPRPPPSI